MTPTITITIADATERITSGTVTVSVLPVARLGHTARELVTLAGVIVLTVVVRRHRDVWKVRHPAERDRARRRHPPADLA